LVALQATGCNQAYVPPQASQNDSADPWRSCQTPPAGNWELNSIGREQNCTIERIREMSRRFSNTYTGYSIGCAIVWAAILAGISLGADSATRHKFMMVFAGWVIGWLSATIARAVYPPPKRRVGP
jgi:hypothetical protein